MRQQLLCAGTQESSYEIRGIVQKARQLEDLGRPVIWENIGDPIQKNAGIPVWMKEIVQNLAGQDLSYGYCDSKGVPETRDFLADRTNALGGCQINRDDILFFNGLGDAISTVYSLLSPSARVITPSPAYSTHGSSEAAHAGDVPITYHLDPENNWYPDLQDLELKIVADPGITAILIINPDNPTGMVYPREILEKMVALAKTYDLFLICDEVYHSITYPGTDSCALSEVIGDVPALAMKGISKEIPWPGSRCGWVEYYNRDKDKDFNRFCQKLDQHKMMEVCSTTLPQLAIPLLLGDERFQSYRESSNARLARRSEILGHYLSGLPGVIFNPGKGSFYNSVIFVDGMLNDQQSLTTGDPQVDALAYKWTRGVSDDSRFVYYLLASTGICVVPLSSFHSSLSGFRITLLEEDEKVMKNTFSRLSDAIAIYLNSDSVYSKAL